MHTSALLWLGLLMSAQAAAQLPTLPEAFGRGTPGAGGVAAGDDLMRVEVPLARYPDALCADGSATALYVRAARSQRHRDDWVIYLQGGGSCDGGEDCHARWLGRDGNFGANKLSSQYAPARGINAGGILSPDGRNPFADWNHAFVYYCSSDGWSGQARDLVAEAQHEGVPTRYRLHQLGARIVDAVIDRLRGGAGLVQYAGPDGTRRALPDLDAAGTVLLAGSSAGGSGVRTHADRVGELLQAQRPGCPGRECDLRYAAVIDASYGLASADLEHAGSRACGPADPSACSYETSMRIRWFGILRGFRDGIADASCEAFHASLGDPWRCADGAHVLEHHLATPFFVRADLQDRLVMGNTVEAGYGYAGVPLDRALYGQLEELQLRALATRNSRAEETPPPSPFGAPGVFGPQCGDHETLRSDEPTFRRAVIDTSGEPRTMLELLANWLAGRQPSVAIETFAANGPPASCGLR